MWQQDNQIPSGVDEISGRVEGSSADQVVCEGAEGIPVSDQVSECQAEGTKQNKRHNQGGNAEGSRQNNSKDKQGNNVDPEEAEMLQDFANNTLRDFIDSDEKEGTSNVSSYAIFKATEECPVWNVGDVFKSRDFFRQVLRQYAVMTRKLVDLYRNDKTKLRVRCKGQGCKWFVYLRKNSTYNTEDYIVMKVNKDHAHTCTQVQKNKWISAKWLGQQFTQPTQSIKQIPLFVVSIHRTKTNN